MNLLLQAIFKFCTTKRLVIGSIYRHQFGSIVNFENALANTLKNFQNQDNYLLMGDFNINWEKQKSCHVIKSYFDHLLTLGCKQIIDKPTRVTINTQTVIDHIYANFVSNSDVSSSIIRSDISDHFPIIAQISLADFFHPEPKIMTRRISTGKIELFVDELQVILNSNEAQKHTDIEYLLNIMLSLTNKFFPNRPLSRKQKRLAQKPWITKGILISIKQQCKLHDIF